jgi:membrane protease YdiL (CAAX protease family)
VGLTGAAMVPFGIYAITVNPVLEEIYWRGNYASSHRTALLNDLFYSLFHLPIYCFLIAPSLSVIPIATLTGAGLFWRFFARKLGGLAIPVLGHAAGDVAVVVAAAAASSG